MPTVFDRYTRAKGWKALEHLPGRALQSAELNELQSIINDERAQLTQTLLSEGSVLSGMELIIDGTTATLTAGQVYAAGFFHDFVQDSIIIIGVGEETIGVKVTQNQITETDDPSLVDPAQGFENFGLPGAYRTTFTLTIALDDDTALPLYILRDGEIIAGPQVPDLSELYGILARRTYDESGSYMVWGLTSSIEARDATTFSLLTDAGKAYVLGFERDIVSAQRNTVNRPLSTRAVLSEAKTFATGTDLYALNGAPVESVSAVAGIVEKAVSVNRGGTPDGSDLMPYTPVTGIISVAQGATTFVEGTDYLVSGDFIDWSPAGAEPATGTTYDVVLRYVKQMVEDSDWQLTGDSIDFSLAGENPVNGTVFNVDYNRYLPRYDLLVMRHDGALIIIEGEPELFPIPPQKPFDSLLLATIYYPANGAYTDVIVTNSGLYRQTFEELAKLKNRIEIIEYNQLVTDLEQDAINVDLPSAKLSIFTDAFRDHGKADLGHGDYSASIDRRRQIVSTSFSQTLHNLPGVAGFRLLCNYTDVLLLSQTYATDTIQLNPFSAFGVGLINLDPADDVWADAINVEVDVNDNNDVKLVSAAREYEFWDEFRVGPSLWADEDQLRSNELRRSAVANIENDAKASGFSRTITVTVNGEQFPANADNLALTFDDTVYPLTPVAPTTAGTNPGTVLADAFGQFIATFEVPAGLSAGVKSVKISNSSNEAGNQFAINQIARTIPFRRNISLYEPIAYSFDVAEDIFVSAIDLYFKTKATNTPIVVSIVKMINGFPSQEVLTQQMAWPDGGGPLGGQTINVSNNATAVSHIKFGTPAFCRAGQQYCVMISTGSPDYSIYYSKLRGKDITSNQVVTVNPAFGVLFKSSNGKSWSVEQDADLKINIYRSKFNASKVFTFDDLTVDGSLIYLMADQVVPGQTKIVWEYSADTGSTWKKIEPNITVDTGTLLSSMRVRATLISAGNGRLSPIMAIPSHWLVAKWNSSGSYIGRNTQLSAFTDLAIFLDTNVPSGAALSVLYSIDAGATWQSAGTGVFQRQVTSDYSEYRWTVSGLASPTQMKVRVDMTANGARTVVPKARRLRMIAT